MMKNKMFRFGTIFLAALVAGTMASCDLNDDDFKPVPVSYVSLYNASPDSPDLGIVVDNRQINSYPFEYSDHTGYLPFYVGNRNIKFSPYGASNTVTDTTITLKDQHVYSIFVVDQFENADVLILEDSSAVPAEGKAMIRFINLSPDAAPVALREKDSASSLTENLSFKEATGFIEVEGKSYNLEVVSSADDASLNLSNVNLAPGSYHTILVRGYSNPPSGNNHVISAEVIKN